MPVLQGDPASPNRNRAPATAYPPSSNYNWMSVVGLVVMVLLVRNVAFHDYRTEAVEYLASRGKSSDEIRAYVPPTTKERKQEAQQAKTDMEQMKADIVMLKKEVKTLQARLEEREERQQHDREWQQQRDDEGGQSLDKIRFQEEEDANAGASKRTPGAKPISNHEDNQQATVKRAIPSKEELEILGSAAEGDLLG